MSRVHIVRHAKAGKRQESGRDDAKRPLTHAGRAQATGLVDVLADEEITQVLSSPYQRCVETVEPLARARGLRVEPAVALVEGSSLATVLALAGRLPGAVLCTHGDIVAALVDEIDAQGLRHLDGPCWAKGSTWSIEVEDGVLTGATYRPPPPS